MSMKKHQLIYLKDWPALETIYNTWMQTRERTLFTAFKGRDPAVEEKNSKLFVEEILRVVRRNIPIGRNPRDYEWDYHNEIKAVVWGPK